MRARRDVRVAYTNNLTGNSVKTKLRHIINVINHFHLRLVYGIPPRVYFRRNTVAGGKNGLGDENYLMAPARKQHVLP